MIFDDSTKAFKLILGPILLIIISFNTVISAPLLADSVRSTNSQVAFKQVYYLLERNQPSLALDTLRGLPNRYKKLRDFYFLEGRIYQELKINANSLASYTVALFIDPSHVKSLINRSLVKGALRDLDGALSDLNQAINLDKKNPIALMNRGVVLAGKGQSRLALKDFKTAIQINPAYADAYLNLGIAYFQMNDSTSACESWEKSLKLGLLDAKQLIQQSCQFNK